MPTPILPENKGDSGTPLASTAIDITNIGGVNFGHISVLGVIADAYVRRNAPGSTGMNGTSSPKARFTVSGTQYEAYTHNASPIVITGVNGGLAAPGFMFLIVNAVTRAVVVQLFIPYSEVVDYASLTNISAVQVA